MCKLTIEQTCLNKIELEFDSLVDAAITAENLKSYTSTDTKFIISCEVTKGEGEDNGI